MTNTRKTRTYPGKRRGRRASVTRRCAGLPWSLEVGGRGRGSAFDRTITKSEYDLRQPAEPRAITVYPSVPWRRGTRQGGAIAVLRHGGVVIVRTVVSGASTRPACQRRATGRMFMAASGAGPGRQAAHRPVLHASWEDGSLGGPAGCPPRPAEAPQACGPDDVTRFSITSQGPRAGGRDPCDVFFATRRVVVAWLVATVRVRRDRVRPAGARRNSELPEVVRQERIRCQRHHVCARKISLSREPPSVPSHGEGLSWRGPCAFCS